MSSEIKFRSWDGNKMRSVDYLEFPLSHPDMILMQFTGLKDKNGKGRDMYEGDVYQQDNRHYVIEWSERNCGWVAKSLKTGTILSGYLQGEIAVYEDYEYIGSIYEHPEFLGRQGIVPTESTDGAKRQGAEESGS